MSDVEIGGATVFTEAGVALKPKKVNPQITDIMVCIYSKASMLCFLRVQPCFGTTSTRMEMWI